MFFLRHMGLAVVMVVLAAVLAPVAWAHGDHHHGRQAAAAAQPVDAAPPAVSVGQERAQVVAPAFVSASDATVGCPTDHHRSSHRGCCTGTACSMSGCGFIAAALADTTAITPFKAPAEFNHTASLTSGLPGRPPEHPPKRLI